MFVRVCVIEIANFLVFVAVHTTLKLLEKISVRNRKSNL